MAAESINPDEVAGCTCLRARRAARQLTRLHEAEPTGLTLNELGLLAKLRGARRRGLGGLRLDSLAGLVGMHFSTFNRGIKTLIMRDLLSADASPNDRRLREVFITEIGPGRRKEAILAWRRAQLHVLDHELWLSLNALLDLINAKVASLRGATRLDNSHAT